MEAHLRKSGQYHRGNPRYSTFCARPGRRKAERVREVTPAILDGAACLRGPKTLLSIRQPALPHHRVTGRGHPRKVRCPVRTEIALDQAAFSTAPSFHPDRVGAPFHRVDGTGAKLRAQGGERPSRGIEHAHSTLAIDEDGEIPGIAIRGHRHVQNVFGLPQECLHNMHIDGG